MLKINDVHCMFVLISMQRTTVAIAICCTFLGIHEPSTKTHSMYWNQWKSCLPSMVVKARLWSHVWELFKVQDHSKRWRKHGVPNQLIDQSVCSNKSLITSLRHSIDAYCVAPHLTSRGYSLLLLKLLYSAMLSASTCKLSICLNATCPERSAKAHRSPSTGAAFPCGCPDQ